MWHVAATATSPAIAKPSAAAEVVANATSMLCWRRLLLSSTKIWRGSNHVQCARRRHERSR